MEVTSGTWVKLDQPAPGPILALDTSTDRATIALALASGEILVAPASSSRQHGRGLVVAIRDLLRQGGVQARDLIAIGVGLGPGSFTGLRIGITAAKTLAYAVECPLFGLDSLEAIARNAPDEVMDVVVIGDAQRGDVFFAEFARDPANRSLRRLGPNQLAPAVELAGGRSSSLDRITLNPSPLVGEGRVGDSSLGPTPSPPPYPPPQGGRERESTNFEAGQPTPTLVLGPPLGRSEPTWKAKRGNLSTAYPIGRHLIALALERMAAGKPDDPYFLEPIYARRSAAEEKATPSIPRTTNGLPA